MHVSISSLLLIALVGRQTDARLSGNRLLIAGLEGLQTPPPTSAYGMSNQQNNVDDLLGAGGHGQQIADPNQFDENGNAIYDTNPVGGGVGSGTDYPDDFPLLGGGGHGQQIMDPNQFDENGNAIYDTNPIGEEVGSGTDDPDDTPLLGGGGHGQQITDPFQFDENGNAIYNPNPVGEGFGSGTEDPDDTPLLGGGGHGQQITDPFQFDENGNAIYGNNPMNTSDLDGFDGTNDSDFDGIDSGINGTDEDFDGVDESEGGLDAFGDNSTSEGMGNMDMDNMGNMTMDNMDMGNMTMDNMDMDMMNELNNTDSGNQNSTEFDGGFHEDKTSDSLNGDGDMNEDIDADADLDGTDESSYGVDEGDGSFPWDREGSSAPSPAVGGGSGSFGFPSYYNKKSSNPSAAPIGENNFGRPTYGQNSYAPLPTLIPSKEFGISSEPTTSAQNFPTWDYAKPTSKPVVYTPPEEQNNDNTAEKDNDNTAGKENVPGGSSIDGTGGIGDYLYFDHGEPIEEMEHDRNVAIALGICSGIGLCLAIITAQQMLENPQGCCASMCRILVSVSCGVTRCICYPCRKICGCTTKQERYSNELISGGGYNEEYISDLELT